MKFSVLLSVYQGDEKDWLKLAFQSITNQTHLPDEIILVEDGKIPRDLKEIIRTFEKNKKKIPLKVISLKQNLSPRLANLFLEFSSSQRFVLEIFH